MHIIHKLILLFWMQLIIDSSIIFKILNIPKCLRLRKQYTTVLSATTNNPFKCVNADLLTLKIMQLINCHGFVNVITHQGGGKDHPACACVFYRVMVREPVLSSAMRRVMCVQSARLNSESQLHCFVR